MCTKNLCNNNNSFTDCTVNVCFVRRDIYGTCHCLISLYLQMFVLCDVSFSSCLCGQCLLSFSHRNLDFPNLATTNYISKICLIFVVCMFKTCGGGSQPRNCLVSDFNYLNVLPFDISDILHFIAVDCSTGILF